MAKLILRTVLHKEVLERVLAEVPKELTRTPIPAIQQELAQAATD